MFDDSSILQNHIDSDHIDKCHTCKSEYHDDIALQKHIEAKHEQIKNMSGVWWDLSSQGGPSESYYKKSN